MEITSLNTSELIATIERSGISFMVLCLFLYALVRVGWWFGDRVIVPLVTAHTGFLNEVKSAVWDIAKSNILINKNMEQLIDIQSENSENIKKILISNQEKVLAKHPKTATIPKTEVSRNESVSAT